MPIVPETEESDTSTLPTEGIRRSNRLRKAGPIVRWGNPIMF